MLQLPKAIFITGIGTGVGKTLTSAVLVEALSADYWKPVQCGNLENSDSVVVKSLISNPISEVYPESYKFKTASSPHYAANVEGAKIDLGKCIPPDTNKTLIIEGAGGLLVPLSHSETIADLIGTLNAPVVLVCRNYLGSINHTLLSIEVLKQRGLKLLGLIFSGPNFLDNEEIIKHFGEAVILGRIEEAEEVNKEFVKREALKVRASFLKQFLF